MKIAFRSLRHDGAWRGLPAVALVLLVGWLASVPCAAGDWLDPATPIRAVVLGRKTITILDDATWSIRGSLALPAAGWAPYSWTTADGRFLAAIYLEGTWSIKGPAKLYVIDAVEGRLVASSSLDFAPEATAVTADGKRAFVLFSGRKAKKGEPAKPPSILGIDTATGSVVARRDLETLPTTVVLAAGERRLLVLWPGVSDNLAAKRRPGRIELFDPDRLERTATLELAGPVAGLFWNGDRSLAYALDQGIDVKAAARSLPAHVFVVDAEAGVLRADLEVGIGPGPLSWDSQRQGFYLLTRPRKTPGAGASLQIIAGDRVTHEIELPRPPLGLAMAPDRSRFYVLEERGISILDGEPSQILGTIPLVRTPAAMLVLDPPTRGYVYHAGSSVVTVVDLENRRTVGEIVTGRTGVKVGQFFAAVGVGVLGMANSQMLYGNPYAMPQVVTVPDPETVGWVGAGRTLVFLHNSQTNDLTVVDTQSNLVVTKFGGSGATLLPDGKTVIAQQAATLQMYDTAARRLLPELEVGMNGMTVCPDGRHLYNGVGLGKGMQRVDIATRRIDPMLEDVAGAVYFLYPRPLPAAEPPAEAALTSAEPPAEVTPPPVEITPAPADSPAGSVPPSVEPPAEVAPVAPAVPPRPSLRRPAERRPEIP